MIETNCNKLSDGLGKMQKLSAVCRSYAAHKMDEQRALKAKKYLWMNLNCYNLKQIPEQPTV